MASDPELPALAVFPLASWREQLRLAEWVACLKAWVAVVEAHLSLPDDQFESTSLRDETIPPFLSSLFQQVAHGGQAVLGPHLAAQRLFRLCFALTSRLLRSSSPPSSLAKWEFLADLSCVYSKEKSQPLLEHGLSGAARAVFDESLSNLKKSLIKNMDAGLNGDLKAVEEQLVRVTFLLRTSPSVAASFLAGSDLVDSLIGGFTVADPSLRGAIVNALYFCLVGIVEGGGPPKLSLLTDQLYFLKGAAESHRAGPLDARDSLVVRLVTNTAILSRLERKVGALGAAAGISTARTKTVLTDLAVFRSRAARADVGPKKRPRQKLPKLGRMSKERQPSDDDTDQRDEEVHVHRMSQISQIQDLFPELGSGFVSKLLDELDSDTEQVVAHLLDGSLPSHLENADRSEQLSPTPSTNTGGPRRISLVPRSTPPQLPARRNVFDDDNLDRLSVSASNLHMGKREDTIPLADPSAANKAAIFSALAAFDSDDDERDDTYDAVDVGGAVVHDLTADETVDLAIKAQVGSAANQQGQKGLGETLERQLFAAHEANAAAFARDAATRRGAERARLRRETGLADEAIEGWALQLARNPRMRRRLEEGRDDWSGRQAQLKPTAWRAAGGTGEDEDGGDKDGDGREKESGAGSAADGGRRGRGASGPRGRGRGGGGNAPPGSEHERRRKEANKSSRANHNRRDQRARKMARGGGLAG